MLEQDREFGGARPPADFGPSDLDLPADSKFGARGPAPAPKPGTNTTIGAVATNAVLTPAEAKRIAIMAQDGLARAVRPIHTPVDGDALFVLATGDVAMAGPRPLALARLGAIAADCVARALSRGVYEAESLGGAPSYRDICLGAAAKART
jgi:L-aminopeptidase/D-esterase-like protein